MARTNHSLRGRLLLSASLVLFVFLGLMGVVLDQAFQRSAEQAVSERLLLHIYGLLTATEESEGSLFLPDALQEPEFNRLGTGLYGMVIDRNGKELWRSASALDLALPPPSKVRLYTNLSAGVASFGYVTNSAGERLFYLSYRVLWQGANEQTTPYTFAVLQTMDAYEGEIRGFRNNLWGWLVGVVVVLIAVQAVVMNWGLSPLKELARDLKQIEDGDKDYLEGDYPAEIDGVTRNLNLLLSSEREQREKYRTTLADLAHSLKTPLAILKGAASSLSYTRKTEEIEGVRETVDEQVGRMNEIVAYQLERAVATSSNLIKTSIEVRPIVERLIEAMDKVYESRQIDIELQAVDCAFFGDERDLMELLGNLVDNACKYCRTKTRVEVASPGKGGGLLMTVEDDGDGISETDRETVLTRGARLDSQEAGQGIGLAVVVEIVKRYKGEIAIDHSILGGVKVSVTLPA